MRFTERKQKLEYLLYMIENGRCNSLNQIAQKFEISKRTAKRMIAELRNEGYKIVYCKTCIKFFIQKD